MIIKISCPGVNLQCLLSFSALAYKMTLEGTINHELNYAFLRMTPRTNILICKCQG